MKNNNNKIEEKSKNNNKSNKKKKINNISTNVGNMPIASNNLLKGKNPF